MKTTHLLKPALLIVLAMLVLFSAIGCNQNSPTPPNQPGESNSGNTDNENTGHNDFEVVITDHLNRQLTFDTPAENIVSGYYISSSMLMALGLSDRVIGIEARAETRPLYQLAAPHFLDLPSIGSMRELDIEAIAALDPDLVVLSVRLKEAIEILESLNIPVLAIDPETTDRLFQAIDWIAQITDTVDRAEQLKAFHNQKMVDVANMLQGQSPPTIYFAGNSDLLSTVSNQMYQQIMIEQAGGISVSQDINDTYWATISYEQLIAYNPDVIILAPAATYSKEEVLDNVNLQGITAIGNQRVYEMPYQIEAWDSPIPSGILGTLWLTSVLHDSVYSSDDFAADATEFYEIFYDFTVDPAAFTY
jgi:iron complex transport system substrate-binding protein